MPGPIILRGEIMRPIGPKESLPDPAAAELVNGIRSEHGKAKHFEGQAHYHQDMAEDALDRIIKLAKKLKDEHGPSPERRAKMVEEIEEKLQEYQDQTDQMDEMFGHAYEELQSYYR